MAEKWKPHPYQKRTVGKVVSESAHGLLLDPGLGKTSIMLEAFRKLRQKGIVKKMLVIAPLRVCHGPWVDEVEKWENFHGLKLIVLHGSKKSKLIKEDADIYCINPEGLAWLERQRGWKWPEMLVVDESTKFKHVTTQRYKILKGLLTHFKRRYILTGSPAPNGLQDLYGQIYLLDFGKALGAYVTHFRHRYMFPLDMGRFKKWVLKKGASVAIERQIKPLVTRLAAKDYLDMPSKINRVVRVRLPSPAMSQYSEMQKNFVVQLREGEVSAANAAVKTSKLRQISNGFLYIDSDPGMGRQTERTAGQIHSAKLDALEALIEELSGQPTLIAYEFKNDYEMTKARLAKMGVECPNIGGGVSTRQTNTRIEAWNQGALTALAVHPGSAAHGLNLQAGGRHLIWFGIPWNLEFYDQTIDRIWRQGQTKRVFVHHLVAVDTMDEVVFDVLRAKSRDQGSLLGALAKRWARR